MRGSAACAASNREGARRWLGAIAAGRAFTTVGISQLTTSRRHGSHALKAVESAPGVSHLKGAMPWVTAAERADVIVTGAVLDNGRQLLIAVPADRAGLTVQPSFPLAALQASCTAEVTCDEVPVTASDVLAGPSHEVMATPGLAGTGGLETSAPGAGPGSRGPGRSPGRSPTAERAGRASRRARRRLDAAMVRLDRRRPGRLRRTPLRTNPEPSQRPRPEDHPGLPDRPQRDRLPPHRARATLGQAGALLSRLVLSRARRSGGHPRPGRALPRMTRRSQTLPRRVRSRQCQGFRRNLSVPVLERALSSSAEGWELGAGGVFSAVGRCLTEPPPLRKGRLQGQGDGACLRRRTLVGGRLDLPDSSSSVPLILRWVALILPRPQALRERRGRVGGRRVWDGAGSGRVGWGRSSIIQIYTPASFENRTQRGSSREKARNPAESLALARLHPPRKILPPRPRRAQTFRNVYQTQ